MSRSLRVFQVDAFATQIFRGNPAAVYPLTHWLPDDVLLAIAREHNLSETAFVAPEGDQLRIRWFTPRQEAVLCGHATLAAAFVLCTILDPARASVTFTSLSGPLHVVKVPHGFTLDFPAIIAEPCGSNYPAAVLAGLGAPADRPVVEAVLVTQADPNYIVVLANEAAVQTVRPDLAEWETLHPHGVIVTARGDSADIVSRYFAPSYGIPEDPVTGSAHCALVPYWSGRLARPRLTARQLSPRGGELFGEYRDGRVQLTGSAVCYLHGTVEL